MMRGIGSGECGCGKGGGEQGRGRWIAMANGADRLDYVFVCRRWDGLDVW